MGLEPWIPFQGGVWILRDLVGAHKKTKSKPPTCIWTWKTSAKDNLLPCIWKTNGSVHSITLSNLWCGLGAIITDIRAQKFKLYTKLWFPRFYIFTPSWGRFPIWLEFFSFIDECFLFKFLESTFASSVVCFNHSSAPKTMKKKVLAP